MTHGDDMKKLIKKGKMLHFITLFINVFMIIAILLLMNYVQKLLYSDVKLNLTEVVTQNKDVITSRLSSEMNELYSASKKLTYAMEEGSIDHLEQIFNEISDDENNRLFVADAQGKAYFRDQSTLDISGRNYHRLAMDGIQNISDRTISRHDGSDVFIISVPIYFKGEVIGTAHHNYTAEEMYETCSLSLYSSQGFMYIINGDGYILIDSRDQAYNQEADNYFRMMYAQGNEDQTDSLKTDIKEEKTGFMETTLDNIQYFSAYTPIEGVHDWYLISSINTNAVSSNANMVINMFYLILIVIVLVFSGSILYFLKYKNKQQQKLLKVAYEDPLTGGNTYQKFMDDMQSFYHKNPHQEYVLLTLDIDNFKYINNYYGFDVGDKLLAQIYHSLEAKLQADETLARISGDHFVMLLKQSNIERINDIVTNAKSNEINLQIYFSVGVYEIKDKTESLQLMIDKANAAANLSKSSMHKKVEFYTHDLNQQMIYNEHMKQKIIKSLANDEMVPFFQPKVNINTRKVIGAEALARWIDKDGTIIPPSEFIPICEKTGLIIELDMMIFRKTLQFLKDNALENRVPISVNFSRIHLNNPKFLDNLKTIMNVYDIPSDMIEIELTESVMMHNPEAVREFTDHMHANGFRISMDDFGSGYSSLNMLKDIPIDVLKIDQIFLKETEGFEKQRIILENIAKMAQQLEISVVVEGVENEQHVELMKSIGCLIAQGYYFAKPMDQEHFEKIYKKGSL